MQQRIQTRKERRILSGQRKQVPSSTKLGKGTGHAHRNFDVFKYRSELK